MANTITATEGYYESQLSQSSTFLVRLKQQLLAVATTVKSEALNTPFHGVRSNFANLVLGDPSGYAVRVAPLVANSANLLGTVTIVDGVASTNVLDAALLSQVTTLWNLMAGQDTGV